MTKKSTDVVWDAGLLDRAARWAKLGTRGGTVWFTGLSGSGKSTIAAALERKLVERGKNAYRLDGDNIRHGLNGDLGFTAADRTENLRRLSQVARLFADSGAITITSFISSVAEARRLARALHVDDTLPFLEIYVDTPLEVCEQRDPKGLYKKARAGEIPHFTGISAPYEVPENPELVLKTSELDVEQCVEVCLGLLSDHGLA